MLKKYYLKSQYETKEGFACNKSLTEEALCMDQRFKGIEQRLS